MGRISGDERGGDRGSVEGGYDDPKLLRLRILRPLTNLLLSSGCSWTLDKIPERGVWSPPTQTLHLPPLKTSPFYLITLSSHWKNSKQRMETSFERENWLCFLWAFFPFLGQDDAISHITAAMTAGASGTILTNPLWVVKTRFMVPFFPFLSSFSL